MSPIYWNDCTLTCQDFIVPQPSNATYPSLFKIPYRTFHQYLAMTPCPESNDARDDQSVPFHDNKKTKMQVTFFNTIILAF